MNGKDSKDLGTHINYFEMQKIKITVTYSVGYRAICFTKTVEMPCAPAIGMIIYDKVDGNEFQVRLKEISTASASISVDIWYSIPDQEVHVEYREHWKQDHRAHAMDTLDSLRKTGWEEVRNDIDLMVDYWNTQNKRA